MKEKGGEGRNWHWEGLKKHCVNIQKNNIMQNYLGAIDK